MTHTASSLNGTTTPLTASLVGGALVRPRRRGAMLAAAALIVVATSLNAAAAKRPKTPHCGGGAFAVDGAPLVAGQVEADVLMIGGGTVTTASGCAPTAPAAFRPARGAAGDLLIARWASCGNAKRVVVRAMLSADCRTLEGTVKSKGGKRRSFTARESMPSAWTPHTPGVDPLPDGAEMVNPAEFLAASETPGFRVLPPNVREADEAAAAAADAENQAIIDAFVAAHPEAADAMSYGVDPNDDGLIQTEDGNYALTIYDDDGQPSEVVTMGPRFQRAVRASALRTFSSRENQLEIYRQRHESANELLGLGLPAPEAIESLPTEEIAAYNALVAQHAPAASQAAMVPGEEIPDLYPRGWCGTEIGAGDRSDGSNYCEHKAGGLWNTATWPLKFYDTCTKQQAGRGTCVSFAITAGRELMIARNHRRWINLSEQHLYFTAKSTHQPALYGDGLDTSGLIAQIAGGYEQPLEERWDYNVSAQRTANDATSTYSNSCAGYNGSEFQYCSDTAGQGRQICTPRGNDVVCALVAAPTAGLTVRSTTTPAELWDAADRDQSVKSIVYTLQVNQMPVVLSLEVVGSFDTPNNDGFVTTKPARPKLCATDAESGSCLQTSDCECSRGSHAVLAVGFVRNDKLPATAKQAKGEGWLVIKNSWGCSADGGYYYLDTDWVTRYVTSARGIGQIETIGELPDQPAPDLRFDTKPTPPFIRIIQPTATETYVEGQNIPLVADGADFQFPQYVLGGTTTWRSHVQGHLGNGATVYASLSQGVHFVTVTYTGKLGTVVEDTVLVTVGPRPADLPPTPALIFAEVRTLTQCPSSCSYACAYGMGYGNDPEDGILMSDQRVRWYFGWENTAPELVSTGGVFLNQPAKFLGCLSCGTTTVTLEVIDSKGQRAQARRALYTVPCVR